MVIGKDGTRARQIEAETGARLVFPEQKSVAIYAPSQQQFEQAKGLVLDALGLTIREGSAVSRELSGLNCRGRVGEEYLAKVVTVLDFGAFVELPTGVHVLLHISQMSDDRIVSVEDVLTEGQFIQVKCVGRDDNGKIILSSKGLIG